MTLAEVVEECKDRHIQMTVFQKAPDEIGLRYQDPLGMMTDDFLEEIRTHKEALIDIVTQQQVIVHAG